MLPSGLGAPLVDGSAPLGRRQTEVPRLEPLPGGAIDDADPASIVVRRESTRLAFIAALQRARAYVESGSRREEVVISADIDDEVLHRFIVAFETGNVPALAALLRHDVEIEMPPIPTWFSGRTAVVEFYATRALSAPARRVVATRANGCPALASYLPDKAGGFVAHNIQVLEMRHGKVGHIYAFLDTEMFTAFGLPLVWV